MGIRVIFIESTAKSSPRTMKRRTMICLPPFVAQTLMEGWRNLSYTADQKPDNSRKAKDLESSRWVSEYLSQKWTNLFQPLNIYTLWLYLMHINESIYWLLKWSFLSRSKKMSNEKVTVKLAWSVWLRLSSHVHERLGQKKLNSITHSRQVNVLEINHSAIRSRRCGCRPPNPCWGLNWSAWYNLCYLPLYLRKAQHHLST